MARIARHSLVWLSPQGWQEAIGTAAQTSHAALIRWRNRDWPAVVRRNDADATQEQVCAGLALPPDAAGNKQRIALRISSAHIHRIEAPLNLAQVIPFVAENWRAQLEALAERSAGEGISFKVYGSASLQSLTGERYMTAASDLDLLFHPLTHAQLSAGLTLLSPLACSLPLDGEIVFPSGQAVSWKEWLNAQRAQSRVLVKDMHSVRLLKMQDLLDTLEDCPCIC